MVDAAVDKTGERCHPNEQNDSHSEGGISHVLKVRLSSQLRQTLIERLATAYTSGQLRLYRRIQALLYAVNGKDDSEVAELLQLAERTVRNYVHAFLSHAAESLRYQPPPGRPSRLTKTQRKELAELITAGPEAAGFASACWTTLLLSELVQIRFGIEYHPHYLAVAVRAGTSSAGIPIEIQIVPGHWQEHPVLAVGQAVQRALSGLRKSPL